jgi:putative DNA primase/helicase
MTTKDQKSSPGDYIVPAHPRDVAEKFGFSLKARELRCYRGKFYQWNGVCYEEQSRQSVRVALTTWLTHQKVKRQIGKDEQDSPIYELKTYHPDPYTVTTILSAYADHELFAIPDGITAPCWINGSRPDPGQEAKHPAREMLACPNGLVNLQTGELVAQNGPRFFNLFALPFAYDPAATTPWWEKFLEQILPGDQEAQETLEEMMGYSISADTNFQKAFLMVGRKRAGKGTIARVLRALIGERNYTGPPLESIGERFGLQPFIDKRVAIIGDAKLEGQGTHRLVSRLLSVTGEDAISVDRKGIEAWEGVLGTRVWVLSNSPPKFTDATGVIVDRFIPIQFRQSFAGREDTGLTAKLLGELPGILNRLIIALARLRARGYFRIPESGKSLLEAMKRAASPLTVFVEDMCELVEYTEDIDTFYPLYRDWCETNGHKVLNKESFKRDLAHLDLPEPLVVKYLGPRGKQRWVITGLRYASRTSARASNINAARAA